MKKFIPIALSALASLIVVAVVPFLVDSFAQENEYQGQQSALVSQNIVGFYKEPTEVLKVYDEGNLIGVLQNTNKLNTKLDEIYKEKYKEKFPGSSLQLGEGIIVVNELSYNQYEDKDAEIIGYLENKNTFALQATAIEFSNSNGVFAVLYVDNLAKYEEALEKYLLYFVDEKNYQQLRNKQTVPSLSTYGTRDTNIKIYQTVTTKETFATPSEIKTSTDEILEYLRYTDGVEKEYYTVQPYDMIDGIATKIGGNLTPQQIVNINDELIQNVDQVLVPGTELLITEFNSPIDVEVTRESIVQEEIYNSEPLLIEDPLMYQGKSEVVQESLPGYKNVMYKETWINGYLVRGEEVSFVVTKQPQQEIIRVGSKKLPNIGTGSFRIPIDNPIVTCRWGCYPGHRAVDFQNAYNRYGNVYAADRGVVKVSSYHSINGYYMVIDHGNGYESYYGHMNTMPYFEVGEVVNKGTIIGQIGKSGKANGPHVHFFIMYNGQRYDPCNGFVGC